MNPIIATPVLLFALLVPGCAGMRHRAEPPVVTLAGIELLQLTVFEQRYRLLLRLQNPNDYPLPISGIHCRLYINEREFAQGVSGKAVHVPRFGEAVVTLEVVSDLRRVFEQIGPSAREADIVSYRLAGKLALEGRVLPLPFEYRGEFDLRAVP